MELSTTTSQPRLALAREMTEAEIADFDKFGAMVAADISGRYFKILDLDYKEGDEAKAHIDGLAQVLIEEVIPPPTDFAGKYRVLDVSPHQQ